MGSLPSATEEDDVAGLEVPLAVRRAARRLAGNDYQQFLVCPVPVVGPGRLAWWELVEACSEELATEGAAEPAALPRVARPRPLLVPVVADETRPHAPATR